MGSTTSIVLLNKHKNFKSLHADINRQSKENFTKLCMAKENGCDNQRFLFIINTDGTYKIIAKHSGKALQPAGLEKGSAIVQCDISPYEKLQDWTLKSLDDGYYIIQNSKTQMVMDVSFKDKVKTGHNLVHQWTFHGGDNQRFKLM